MNALDDVCCGVICTGDSLPHADGLLGVELARLPVYINNSRIYNKHSKPDIVLVFLTGTTKYEGMHLHWLVYIVRCM